MSACSLDTLYQVLCESNIIPEQDENQVIDLRINKKNEEEFQTSNWIPTKIISAHT